MPCARSLLLLLATSAVCLKLPNLKLPNRRPPSPATVAAASSSELLPIPSRVEVLPPLTGQAATALSDEAVANIFELVWRDTRMLFSTVQKRPLPVACELAWERWPIAWWFIRDRMDKLELQLNDELQSCQLFGVIAPRAAVDLKWQRERVVLRLNRSRTTLWPTLRALLMRPTTHQRVLQAARTELVTYKQTAGRSRGVARLLNAAVRYGGLWLALWRWALYGLRWLWITAPGLGPVRRSTERRQRVQTELIEKAIRRGLQLQRRVDNIDQSTFRVDREAFLAEASSSPSSSPPWALPAEAGTGGGAQVLPGGRAGFVHAWGAHIRRLYSACRRGTHPHVSHTHTDE